MLKRIWIVIVVMLLLDLYVFQAVRYLSASLSPRSRTIVYGIYWLVSAAAVVTVMLLPYMYQTGTRKKMIVYATSIVIGLVIAKLIGSAFFLVDDVRRLFTGIFRKAGVVPMGEPGEGISRSAFLSWMGIAAGGTLFSTLLYGFSNKYNYRVHRVKMAFDLLPESFRGLRILQLSDIHSGSFNDKEAVIRGVELAMREKPDLILFTGDLVNDRALEMDGYIEIFKKLNAPLGVFSVLGNHDYGDYFPWPDRDEEHLRKEEAAGKRLNSPLQEKNLEELKAVHQSLNWKLLMNEHVVLERGEDKIAVLGIENWSARAHFPKYGKLREAIQGAEDIPFQILMSHDPSHWDAEVKQHYRNIDLTLSGHTHGMQFGIEIPGFRWSPIKYVYKKWAGLYEDGVQKLYINRGFGFLGYPGRVGILPEITVIELV
jgi:uncharacterized protein